MSVFVLNVNREKALERWNVDSCGKADEPRNLIPNFSFLAYFQKSKIFY